jgi:putative DNA-invertase from lambdoid prophage Rac
LTTRRLLAAVQAGDIVITAKLDRAFRSAADALGTLEQLKEDKIALHMIDLGGDVTGNGISKLVFTILSAVAENERDRIRERIRDVKRDNASRRLFNGGLRTFGYDIDGEGKDRRLVPNADEQRVLARGRAMRAKGKTYRDIGCLGVRIRDSEGPEDHSAHAYRAKLRQRRHRSLARRSVENRDCGSH